jgi:hypothetical protein
VWKVKIASWYCSERDPIQKVDCSITHLPWTRNLHIAQVRMPVGKTGLALLPTGPCRGATVDHCKVQWMFERAQWGVK